MKIRSNLDALVDDIKAAEPAPNKPIEPDQPVMARSHEEATEATLSAGLELAGLEIKKLLKDAKNSPGSILKAGDTLRLLEKLEALKTGLDSDDTSTFDFSHFTTEELTSIVARAKGEALPIKTTDASVEALKAEQLKIDLAAPSAATLVRIIRHQTGCSLMTAVSYLKALGLQDVKA